MRRVILLVTVVILLIAGGYISYAISKDGAGALPGLKVQTDNARASAFSVTAEKGAQFIIFAAVALGSVVGMGATLALVFWLLNRQVAQARATDKPKPAASNAASTADSA